MDGCAICDRAVETTTHHLTPKNRRESDTAPVCDPCHRQIHASFTNHELRHEFDTVEALRSADRLQGFLGWLRRTNPRHVAVRETDHVRRWRE